MAQPSGIVTESEDSTLVLLHGWIQSALQEYEQIASLCNAQTLLINAVESVSPFSKYHGDGDCRDDIVDDDLDSLELRRRLQQRNLYEKLSNYYQQIDIVRKTHAAMKSQLFNNILSNMQEDCGNDKDPHGAPSFPSPMIVKAMTTSHLELSERVIRTVMKSPCSITSSSSSSSASSQCCGVLFENGIVRASSSSTVVSDHEVNVVALASLRASVSRLKVTLGGDDKK